LFKGGLVLSIDIDLGLGWRYTRDSHQHWVIVLTNIGINESGESLSIALHPLILIVAKGSRQRREVARYERLYQPALKNRRNIGELEDLALIIGKRYIFKDFN